MKYHAKIMQLTITLRLIVPMFLFVSMFVALPVKADNAWCGHDEVNSGNYAARCVSQVYDSLPGPIQNTLGNKDAFIDQAKACMTGNSDGVDFNIHEGDCVNAVKSCLTQALDVTQCTSNNLKTIANLCDYGTITGDHNCDRLTNMNNDAISLAKELRTKMAGDGAGCTAANQGNETQKTDGRTACQDAYNKAAESCSPPTVDRFKGLVTGSFEEYKTCLDKALKSSARDGSECTARGGIYVGQYYGDPVKGSNSNVSSGCYNNFSDLINEPACTAAGGKWGVTGGGVRTIDYGCMPPDGKNNDNTTTTSKDGSADCVKNLRGECASLPAVDSHCGEARVNILVCGNGKGNEALTNILRIVLMVLTLLVGIAAVAGLALASIKYANAGDNSGTVSEAKDMIRNIVIGILLYGFLVAIVNWLVPGVVFG